MKSLTAVLFLVFAVPLAFGDDDFEKHVRPLLVELKRQSEKLRQLAEEMQAPHLLPESRTPI